MRHCKYLRIDNEQLSHIKSTYIINFPANQLLQRYGDSFSDHIDVFLIDKRSQNRASVFYYTKRVRFHTLEDPLSLSLLVPLCVSIQRTNLCIFDNYFSIRV